jgi:putative membrane protein
MSTALMAFLHHLAAFALVAALAVEIVLCKLPLDLVRARGLRVMDRHFGLAAAAVLVIGLLRVFYFEKGPHYYWHDTFFLVKFGAFIAAGLISIYPTMVFLSWGSAIRAGQVPAVAATVYRRLRLCLWLELAAIVVILLCAPLMARGFGAF